MGWALSIDKTNIAEARLVETEARALQPGEARLKIDHFALTANNITYAAFGEAMRYWDFFPGQNKEVEDGRGRLPVWGFADIAESRADGAEVGARYYGYFPAADELIVTPARADATGFFDAAPHRAALSPVYNRYIACAADPAWSRAGESVQMVLQPLFVTSFLIAAHLREEKAFGADAIALSSASSKTALALAFILHKAPIEGVKLIGATSSTNEEFVVSTGYYDEVLNYNAIETMPLDQRYCLVDFAGSSDLNTRLHNHLADQIAVDIRVGGAHWEKSEPVRGLPGPKPVFFFAPDHARARGKAWGQAEFERRYKAEWAEFAKAAGDLLDFTVSSGGEGALATYQALVGNQVLGREARIVEI